MKVPILPTGAGMDMRLLTPTTPVSVSRTAKCSGFALLKDVIAMDMIEWIADRDWCNGKTGMTGNSWLAIAQWYAAAEQPPHLTALAPWEGLSDYYNDFLFVGGIPTGVDEFFTQHFWGKGYIEDIPAMMEKYPFMNSYWEDKIPEFEKIHIPAYIVASWTNNLHTIGTFRGFRSISSPDKWLRVHNTHEWPDYYIPEHVEELRSFFDRFLKGIQNDWEKTPRVRLSILDPGGEDVINRPENEFPLARTQYLKLFLNAETNSLSLEPPVNESLNRYTSDDGKGRASFTIKFIEDTELTGYMKAHLWVEAGRANDMDLYVTVEKLDKSGNFLPAYSFMGTEIPTAYGQLRVSRREPDKIRATFFEPYHTHRKEQLLNPGEIVQVEIGLRLTGMVWHAGEQLRLVLTGHRLHESSQDARPGAVRFESINKGDHIIHTGGKYDSYLLVPKIPKVIR